MPLAARDCTVHLGEWAECAAAASAAAAAAKGEWCPRLGAPPHGAALHFLSGPI